MRNDQTERENEEWEQNLTWTLELMYLHSAELKVVAVTENVNPFLLV